MNVKSMKLLLVDDDDEFRQSCAKWMQQKGLDVEQAECGATALVLLGKSDFDVAVLDINMPGMSGLELLERIRSAYLDVEVVMLTGESTVSSAVAAMKLGAYDFLSKPCSLHDLERIVQLAYQRGQLRKENRQLKAVISRSRPRTQLIGKSTAIKDVLRTIEKVAPTDSPVLIQGDSGTGKEVVARLIQEASLLNDRPFVTINCAALPEQLVESELFGHQKGAFTGATTEKQGLFEIADGGTLFIDEIGEMPLALQPKLLRVLEDGSMRRLGSNQERRVSVRLIAATNRNLSQELANRNFREDLFYRINVVSIDLPTLCQRTGDIDLLIDYFLDDSWTLDASARQALNQYSWPGNVRQLLNVLRRATVLAERNQITLNDLPREITLGEQSGSHEEVKSAIRLDNSHSIQWAPNSTLTVGDSQIKLDELARAHILGVLAKENGNKTIAAKKLGIHRRKLYRLLDRMQQSPAAPSPDVTCVP
jgi:DNA-binding NtrC family response regulator